MANSIYAEPGGYSMEQMAALSGAVGAQTTIMPRVGVIPRETILAQQAAMTGVGLGAGAAPMGLLGGGAEFDPASIVDPILAALGAIGITIPEPITTVLGAAALGYAGAQALGMGEGEGLFGLDILGGNGAGLSPTGGLPVPIGGPGLAEPGKPYLLKEWHITYPKGRAQYYLVQRATLGGRKQRFIMMYKTWDGTWDWWRMPKPTLAIIGKRLPSHKQLTRLKRNLARHAADAKTILKITNPTAYVRQLGYKKPRRRR